jgi:hypothetical protein
MEKAKIDFTSPELVRQRYVLSKAIAKQIRNAEDTSIDP